MPFTLCRWWKLLFQGEESRTCLSPSTHGSTTSALLNPPLFFKSSSVLPPASLGSGAHPLSALVCKSLPSLSIVNVTSSVGTLPSSFRKSQVLLLSKQLPRQLMTNSSHHNVFLILSPGLELSLMLYLFPITFDLHPLQILIPHHLSTEPLSLSSSVTYSLPKLVQMSQFSFYPTSLKFLLNNSFFFWPPR